MIKRVIRLWRKFSVWKFKRYVKTQVSLGMTIGKNVMITPGAKFDPPHSFLTSIGDNCIIAPNVYFLNHDASLFAFSKTARIGRIDIKESCFIGLSSILLPGIKIGPNSIVGAGSVVTKDVPPNCIVAGNPAKVIKKLDEYVHINKTEISNCPNYKSDEFYASLNNSEYKNNVRENLLNSIGYTIGFDNDETFIFNGEI